MLQELDCCGLACPGPVIQTRNLVNSAHPEAILVRVDNAAASQNVRRFLESRGYSAEAEEKDGVWLVHGRLSSGAQPQEQAESSAGCPVCGEETLKTLVFLPSATIGSGSDELGAKLMANFLATLPELGERLWRVVLVNGGVKLAAQPGRAQDSLRALEAAGTDILVCGTCLDFYGLMDVPRVGQVTNMLDIVTSFDLADKVIRP